MKGRFLIVLLVFPFLAFSQMGEFKIYNLSTEDGLLSNNIECLYKDSYGFLWMGSFDGLVRWDGYSYKKYTHQDADSTTISQNIIYTIFEDSKRRLWVGSIGGLDLYNRETDSFQKIDLKRSMDRVPLNGMVEDKNGLLWLGCSEGLCRYDPSSGNIKWFYESNHPDSLSCNSIFSIARDENNNIWMATFRQGVAKYSIEKGTFERFVHQENNPRTVCSNKLKKIIVDHQGNVWVGSFDNGVTHLSNQGLVLKHYGNAATQKGIQNHVSCLYEDRQHTIWMCKATERLQYLDEHKKEFISFTNPTYKKYHLQCKGITSLSEDDFGNTFFGSFCNGLFYSNMDKNKFQHYFYNYVHPNELTNDVVTCFYEQNPTQLWIGTEGGLNLFNAQTKTFEHFTKKDGLSSEHIQDIKQDPSGKLWFATWSGGLIQIDPNTKAIQTFTNQPGNDNSLIYNNIKSIVMQDSILWIGTHGAGLCAYNLKRKEFTHYKNNKLFPFAMAEPLWINHLFLDSKNRLWIGTYGGLYMFDQKIFHRYFHSNDTSSISNQDVNMIAEDLEGNIWIATEAGGLVRYLPKSNSFRRYQKGLPSTIKALQVDNENNLWLTGNDGLYRFQISTGNIDHYDQSDGLQSNSFFLKAILKDHSGNLLIGGANGFNIFNPTQIHKENKPSTFYFTDLLIFDQFQKPGAKNSAIDKQLSFLKELSLSYDQSFFTIYFTLVDFYSSSNTLFAYQLEGLHNDWIQIGHERKISFTELPSGKYRLRIRYTLHDGTWKEADKTLVIQVYPAWWNSWWFRLLLFFAFCVLLVVVYLHRVKNIKERNEQLKLEVNARTVELSERNSDLQESNEEIRLQKEKLEIFNDEVVRQSDKILKQQEFILTQNKELETLVAKLSLSDETKNLFFTILAHDLKGPINAIGSLSDLLSNNIESLSSTEIKEFIHHIQKSSSSTRTLLYNLLDWARAQSEYLDCQPKGLNANDLVVRNLQVLEQQLLEKKITIDNSIHPQHTIFADENMMDTVIRNILSNCLKYTPDHGSIQLESFFSEKSILLTLSDSGVGMSETELENLFLLDKRTSKKGTLGESGTGLGMIIVKEFIELNKGTIRVESKEGKGTSFILELPANTEIIAPKERSFESEELVIDSATSVLSEEQLVFLKGNRILIVDDNLALRNHLKYLLSSIFEIIEAENGQEALSIAAKTQPTVIITDMVMPVMDGLEFCRTIKKDPETSHIPVILLTSHDTEESKRSGYFAGADIYLTKPVKKEFLLQIVLNILQSRELLRQKLIAPIKDVETLSILNSLDLEFLEKISNYIELHLSDQELDVHQIVRHLGMSRSVLYSKFKAIAGQGINEFIRTIRLQKSKQLLQNPSLTINEIAESVGFNSASYFIRCFVKEYDCTPLDFRERLLQKNSGSIGLSCVIGYAKIVHFLLFINDFT